MKLHFPFRYVIILATFSLALLLYIDRVCISVAKEPIIADLNITDLQMGWVLSAFALGYALFQIPGGWLADKLGTRNTLTLVVSFWSLFTAATGMAWSFISLLAARFFFGVGEAGAFPGMARTSYSWIPLRERGVSTGINFSGSRIGAAFSLPLIAWLIHTVSWRITFLLLGVLGLVWALVWYWLFRNDPTDHPFISETEKNYILEHRQKPPEEDHTLPLTDLIKSGNMRWMMLQYFCNNFTFFFAVTWLFPYIKEKFQLEAVETGFIVALPLMMGAVGSWVSGLWVDAIFRKGHWTRSRRLPALTGFFLAALGLFTSVYMDSVWGSILFLSVSIFGADMTMSPSWSVCTDIGRKNAGIVSGTMNMAGNLGAFVTALAFPYLKDWLGSVVPFFFIGTALNLLAMYCWLRVRPDQPIDSIRQ